MEKYFEIVGTYGKYQKILQILLTINNPYFSLYSLSYSFITKVPEFDCTPKSASTLTPSSPPYNITSSFPCTYSKSLCTQSLYTFTKNKQRSFDNLAYSFDLYCSRESYSPMISTSYFIGAMLSNILIGGLPDKYGRKRVYQILLFCSCFCYLNLLFPISPWHVIIIYFIGGLLSFGTNVPFYMVAEFLPKTISGKITCYANSAFPMASILITFYFLFINNYKGLYFCLLVIHLLSTYYSYKYLLESPRWLMARNENDEAMDVFKKIAEINGTKKEWEIYINGENKSNFLCDNIKENENINQNNNLNSKKRSYNFFQVLKYKSQRKNALILSYIFFCSGFCIYGIILNLSKLKGNFFLNSVMGFTGEFISIILSGKICDKYGRLFLLKYSILLGAIFLIFFMMVDNNLIKSLFLFCSMIGLSANYFTIGIFISETFPTCIRALVMAYLKFCSRIGPLIVPLLSHRFGNDTNYFIIVGGISIFCLCFMLKETLGVKLEDEIPEEVNKEKFLEEE